MSASREHLDSAHILKENEPSRSLGKENTFTVQKATEMYVESYLELKGSLQELSEQPVDEQWYSEIHDLANDAVMMSQRILNDTRYSGDVNEARQYALDRRSDL